MSKPRATKLSIWIIEIYSFQVFHHPASGYENRTTGYEICTPVKNVTRNEIMVTIIVTGEGQIQV